MLHTTTNVLPVLSSYLTFQEELQEAVKGDHVDIYFRKPSNTTTYSVYRLEMTKSLLLKE